MPETPRKTPPDSRKPRAPLPGGGPPLSINWRTLMWYLPIMLMLLWLWQDMFYTMAVKTIPYSDFKQHVARHEVFACDVKEDEIVGEIRPCRTTSSTPAVA